MTRLLIVIVIYEELLNNSESYNTLMKALECPADFNLEIYVHDNSSEKQFDNGCFQVNGIKHYYFHDSSNVGISKAYNSAEKYAVANNYQWLLFLDQDTTLPSDLLLHYEQSMRKNVNIDMFVPLIRIENGSIISPFRNILNVGVPIKKPIYGVQPIAKYGVINSALMVTAASFKSAGGYNELVKLDFSDMQFVQRYSKRYVSFFVTPAVCCQNLSTQERDVDRLLKRFEYFCQGARHCHRESIFDDLTYIFIVLKRTISLTWSTKSTIFIRKFASYYKHDITS